MNSPKPKRQHFVAQMLLRRFTDENGKLFFFDKRFPSKGVLPTTPKNLYCQGNIYTAKDKQGNRDFTLELAYAALESRTSPIVQKIVSSARRGHAPGLTSEERDLWDLFFYQQWIRVPDFQQKFFETVAFEKELKKAVAAIETFRPLTPQEKQNLQDPQWLERVKQNARINALSRTFPRILQALNQKGLGIAIIRNPGKSFVTGSLPVVKLALPGRPNPADPTVEMWLPVAHDVAVSPAPIRPTGELVLEIHDPHIRGINGAIFKQSTAIAGRSRRLIDSLARSR